MLTCRKISFVLLINNSYHTVMVINLSYPKPLHHKQKSLVSKMYFPKIYMYIVI